MFASEYCNAHIFMSFLYFIYFFVLAGNPVNNNTNLNGAVEPQSEHVFIAFARIFSGTVRKGCKLFVLGPKHDPEKALQVSFFFFFLSNQNCIPLLLGFFLQSHYF